MIITSIIPIIPIIFLSIITLLTFNRVLKISLPKGRYQSIDGLRGYLALFVFFHHSVVWYFYLLTGRWTFPPSHIYNHMGPTSVGLFFMITSFLFISKLADAKKEALDWARLYIGRILRIVPLYLLICLIIFLIAGGKTGWKLSEPIELLLIDCLKWLCFIQGEVNNYPETRLIVARVVWSLAFEWMFYFSLPLWAIFLFRIKVSKFSLILSLMLLFIFIFIIWEYYPARVIRRSCPFLGGVAAAFLSRKKWVQKLSQNHYMSSIMVVLIFITSYFYADAYSLIPYLCMVGLFIPIAAGNSFFGILTHNYSRLLGQISYSIYLLHGTCLFIAFRCIPGSAMNAVTSPINYWIFLALICIILIVLCCLTYYFIERPFIINTPVITNKIERFLEDSKTS